MASNAYHKMNDFISEIDRLDESIFNIKVHMGAAKNSTLANKLKDLIDKRTMTEKQLDDHLSAWIEKIPKEAVNDNSKAILP